MKSALLITILFLAAPTLAYGQQSDLDQIESMFSTKQQQQGQPYVKPTDRISPPTEDLSQVRKLEPFKDIAVIEKRYFPKTHRFEAYLGLGGDINDAFFNSYESDLRLGYHINEAYAVELSYQAVGTSDKTVTHDLRTDHGVNTQAYVTPLSYIGASFKWSPFYGKMTYLNHRIVHFDHYFTAGAGEMHTNQRTTPVAFQLGTGQLYALNKSWAFRWDLNWLIYSSQTSTGTVQQANNLFVTVGACFFFPGAKYR